MEDHGLRVIETGGSGRVTRFLEKPSRERLNNMINPNLYLERKSEQLPPNANYSFETQFYGPWAWRAVYVSLLLLLIDIGTPEKYFQLHADLLSGKSRGYEFTRGNEVSLGNRCQIDPAAELQGRVVIGDDCEIGRGVKITGPAVIGPGNIILEETIIEESVIWHM